MLTTKKDNKVSLMNLDGKSGEKVLDQGSSDDLAAFKLNEQEAFLKKANSLVYFRLPEIA